MANDGWRPDYENVKDIMRPYEPDKDAKANWRAKVEEEARQQQKTKARSRRRIWPWQPQRQPKPKPVKQEEKERPAAASAGAERLHAAAQIASYAAILLLAPLISQPGGFYLLVLLLALPVTTAALLLRPLGPQAWLLRAAVPLLPVEAWFALRYFSWNPGMTLGLASLCALAGSLYYFFAVRGKGPANTEQETQDEELELDLNARRQARRGRNKGELQDEKERRRRLLLFAVPLACVSLLAPALLGFGMQFYRPEAVAEAGPAPQRDEAYMMDRMAEAYAGMLPGVWASMGRAERQKALQALLDAETDNLRLPRYDLRDPAVLFIDTGKGAASVSGLLLTGRDKTQLRVISICRLAWRLRQLHITQESNTASFDEHMIDYGNSRYKDYVKLWGEGSHAG